MMTHEHGRQLLVIVAVITLHVLFLLALLMRDTVRVMARGVGTRDPVLFFIEDRPQPALRTPPPATTLRQAPNPSLTILEPSVSDGTPATGSVEPPPNPPTIDWGTQATQAASAAVDEAIRQETRKCDPSEKPSSFLPPCNPPRHRFEWSPQPRVGFSGGLPYVRLGERCVVGLGFFGCGFGAKPPANGELFEHMDDPERDRSSVPALDELDPRRQHVPSMQGPDSGRSETAGQD